MREDYLNHNYHYPLSVVSELDCREPLELSNFSHGGLKVQLGLVAGSGASVREMTQCSRLRAEVWRVRVQDDSTTWRVVYVNLYCNCLYLVDCFGG